jgi:hypothetical protein
MLQEITRRIRYLNFKRDCKTRHDKSLRKQTDKHTDRHVEKSNFTARYKEESCNKSK